MEVTGLKELKKLMKGDARDKFEFEEDAEAGSCYEKGMLFSYANNQGGIPSGKSINAGATYHN